MTTERFAGKVALVTGSGRGQGRQHAVRFAEEGADVIAIDVCAPIESAQYGLGSEDDLAETVRLAQKGGARVASQIVDVRDPEAVTTIQLLPVPYVEVDDVTNAVLWFASDEARMITGVALPVDAGALLKK